MGTRSRCSSQMCIRDSNDAGLMQAASIPKRSHIQIDRTAVTYEGLIAIAENNRDVYKRQVLEQEVSTEFGPKIAAVLEML